MALGSTSLQDAYFCLFVHYQSFDLGSDWRRCHYPHSKCSSFVHDPRHTSRLGRWRPKEERRKETWWEVFEACLTTVVEYLVSHSINWLNFVGIFQGSTMEFLHCLKCSDRPGRTPKAIVDPTDSCNPGQISTIKLINYWTHKDGSNNYIIMIKSNEYILI